MRRTARAASCTFDPVKAPVVITASADGDQVVLLRGADDKILVNSATCTGGEQTATVGDGTTDSFGVWGTSGYDVMSVGATTFSIPGSTGTHSGTDKVVLEGVGGPDTLSLAAAGARSWTDGRRQACPGSTTRR